MLLLFKSGFLSSSQASVVRVSCLSQSSYCTSQAPSAPHLWAGMAYPPVLRRQPLVTGCLWLYRINLYTPWCDFELKTIQRSIKHLGGQYWAVMCSTIIQKECNINKFCIAIFFLCIITLVGFLFQGFKIGTPLINRSYLDSRSGIVPSTKDLSHQQ